MASTLRVATNANWERAKYGHQLPMKLRLLCPLLPSQQRFDLLESCHSAGRHLMSALGAFPSKLSLEPTILFASR